MKKEWLLLIVVLIIIYLDSIIYIYHDEVHISGMLIYDFFILLYHVLLFLFVSYYLIPKFFYPKKYLYFFLSVFASICLFAFVEEGIIERVFVPESRGMNVVSWKSIYYFIGENIVPLLSFMTIKFVFDNLENEKRIEQIEKNQLTNELKFLKSQIQPHILFNSLNNLYDFTLSKSDRAPELVLGLSNVLRYVLYETVDEKVVLTKELDFLKDYIALQKMQVEGRGQVNFQIKENANPDQLKISPFLLIPYIENSFKHSLQTKETEIIINVEIEISQQLLILKVENNFEKANSSDSLLTSGIGLKNVKKRLQLLYSNRHQLNIEDQNKWYIVDLKINL